MNWISLEHWFSVLIAVKNNAFTNQWDSPPKIFIAWGSTPKTWLLRGLLLVLPENTAKSDTYFVITGIQRICKSPIWILFHHVGGTRRCIVWESPTQPFWRPSCQWHGISLKKPGHCAPSLYACTMLEFSILDSSLSIVKPPTSTWAFLCVFSIWIMENRSSIS